MTSKKGVSLEFIEDLKAAWGNDQETVKILQETREALSEIQWTLNILETSLCRIEQLRVRDRRKRLKVVKGSGRGAKAL